MSKKQKQKKQAAVEQLTPEIVIKERRQQLLNQEDVRSFVTRLILFLILLFVLFGIVFGIQPMKNDDMSPRISAGDLMLYYRLESTYQSQDVIVFEKEGQTYIGRVVAKGGDSVEITEDSELQVNESIVMENDIYYKTPQYEDGIEYPCELEEDQYFVLCDYREGAKDSRIFGPVDRSEIKGNVITVIRRSGL